MQGRVSPQFTTHLKDIDPDELRAMADAARALKESRGYEIVVDLLDRAHDAALQRLVRGSAKTEAAEYAKDLGLLDGMSLFLDAVETILARAEAQAREAERLAELANREA